MKRISEQQKQAFFGRFAEIEDIANSMLGEDFVPRDFVDSVKLIHGDTIANEVKTVLNALRLEQIQWHYFQIEKDMTRVDSVMAYGNGLFRFTIIGDNVIDVDFADIDSTNDHVVTPLLKDMGYVNVHPDDFLKNPTHNHKQHPRRTGCKVTKKVDGLNIQITAVQIMPRPTSRIAF